jgi:hypothetical protein
MTSAEHQGQAHRLEGHLHGALGAEDQAGEHVASQVVGPEPVAGRTSRPRWARFWALGSWGAIDGAKARRRS